MTKRILAYFVVTFAVITCLCCPVVAQVTQTNQVAKSNWVTAPPLALRWLKEHQNRDGSWGSNPTNRAALTGLAILAYIAKGETPDSRDFGMTVEKGLQRLLYDVEASKTNETLGGIENEHISTEAIVTYALAEAYGMTQMILLREPTSNMVNRVVASKSLNPIWTPCAVRAAILSGAVEVSDDGKKRLLESCLASIKGSNLLSHATAMSSIQLLGQWHDVQYQKGRGITRSELVDSTEYRRYLAKLDEATKLAPCDWNQHHEPLPLLTWFVTSQVLYEQGGRRYEKWNKEFPPTVLKNQQDDGRLSIPVSKDGSGEKERAMWGDADSDIYATCLIPILFAPGRHGLPAYMRSEKLRRALKDSAE